jgi:hypothetical protein
MTVAIRGPAGIHSIGRPDVAIAVDVTPAAVVVQVFVPGHFSRNILRTAKAILTTITIKRPAFEIVLLANAAHVIRELVGS